MDRVILHCDCNCFFASVEMISRPELREVPMAVCGDPESRHGIILAKNEKAKAFRVQTAETIWQAKSKCPQLVLVKPHYQEYARISKAVNEIYHRFTDYIEPFGIDESWLDVTDSQKLFGDGRTIADTLRETVRKELGITISVGVSFNKVFAKLGSDYKKPDATTVVDRENFRKMLFPLPASDMLYVGRATRTTLEKLGIRTIGELAAADPNLLNKHLGKLGYMLNRYANGEDSSRVMKFGEQEEIKSVSNGMTFLRDLVSEQDVRTAVTALCDLVSSRMRKYCLKCTTVSVTVKSPDFHSFSRQKTLPAPVDSAKALHDAALELIGRMGTEDKPIRSLTIAANQLTSLGCEGQQIGIFDENASAGKDDQVSSAMDRIRSKYGNASIRYGSVIKNDLGIK